MEATTFPILPDAPSELSLKPRKLVSSLRIGSCMFPSVLTTSVMLLWATSEASFAVWIYGTMVPSCSERAVREASVWSLLSRISSLEPLMTPLALSASFKPWRSSLTPLLMASTEAAIWSMLSYNWSPASFQVSLASFRSTMCSKSFTVPGTIAMMTPEVSNLSLPMLIV